MLGHNHIAVYDFTATLFYLCNYLVITLISVTMIPTIQTIIIQLIIIIQFIIHSDIQTKDIKTSPSSSSQLCSGFNERCAMCWIEWKIIFQIFIFRVMVKIHWKFTILSTKMTISQKLKFAKIWKLIFHSFQNIA